MKKLLLTCVLAGLATSAMAVAKPLKVQLTGENGSGESGYALLYPHGSRTRVIIHMHGVPKGLVQPDHIHAGTCPNVNPRPAYMLKPIKDGRSVTLIHARLAALLHHPMAINVHESSKDMQKYVACGDIRGHY